MKKSVVNVLSIKGLLSARIFIAIGASLFIALSAQFSIPLPYSPVPVTMQTLTVVLTGIFLGSRLGTLSVLTYLLQGAMGFPVFAGGMGGIAYLTGPTGGYLFGFVLSAYLAGYLTEKSFRRNVLTTAATATISLIPVYLFGIAWLSLYTGWDNALTMGLLPFLPGEAYKLFIISGASVASHNTIKKLIK